MRPGSGGPECRNCQTEGAACNVSCQACAALSVGSVGEKVVDRREAVKGIGRPDPAGRIR